MTVTTATSNTLGKDDNGQTTQVAEETHEKPKGAEVAQEKQAIPCKTKLEVDREDVLPVPTDCPDGATDSCPAAYTGDEATGACDTQQSCDNLSSQCPFLSAGKQDKSETAFDKLVEASDEILRVEISQHSPSEVQTPAAVASHDEASSNSDPSPSRPEPSSEAASEIAPDRHLAATSAGSPPHRPYIEGAEIAPDRHLAGTSAGSPAHRPDIEGAEIAPDRHLPETSDGSSAHRSDIEGAECAAEPARWTATPVDEQRRRLLFVTLRDAGMHRSPSTDRAVDQAVRAMLCRSHPELRVHRFPKPPESLCGDIGIEGFMREPTRPVHVRDDLFLAPAALPRDQAVSMIRGGQYHRGASIACFYAYLYAYEFVFYCEYLRHIQCHTTRKRAVLRGVLQRARNMHLITHSATIFSLAPEVMYSQRSPFLYMARLFPMQEQWEADLLCQMANCCDMVAAAADAWHRREHVLFAIHQDMKKQARLRGRRSEPSFHPAVLCGASSSAAFSNIEGEQVERLDSHGLVVFQESGATYSDVDACCRFAPLGQLSAEEVLRRTVGRHALVRLYDDVFFMGAPAVDLRRAVVRYLRPAEVRLHVQVGFYFESPSYATFMWSTQRGLTRTLLDACQSHSPQLSAEEAALVRWMMLQYLDISRRGVHKGARDLAQFGPYLLNEYGKTLWRSFGEHRFASGTLKLCTDLAEHARSRMVVALAQHNCLQGS